MHVDAVEQRTGDLRLIFLGAFGRPPAAERRIVQMSAAAGPRCLSAIRPISLKSLKVVSYLEDPKTLADHLRRKRNESGLHQQEVAGLMAVSEWTYANWENGRTTPGAVIYRGIVEFLGYYPHPTPRNLSDRLRKIRRCHGLTSRQAAHLAGVDHQTFLMWEHG